MIRPHIKQIQGDQLITDRFVAQGNLEGQQDIVTGNWFFSTSNFISPEDICSKISLSAGTLINSTSDWLQFFDNGKILFINRQPIRSNLSYDNVEAVIDPINGTQITIEYNGEEIRYNCRLPKGGNANPCYNITALGQGSEWNRLMYRVNADKVTDAANGVQIRPNFVELSNVELGIGTGAVGVKTLCQEPLSSDNSKVLLRGDENSISASEFVDRDYVNTNVGLRLVLELET